MDAQKAEALRQDWRARLARTLAPLVPEEDAELEQALGGPTPAEVEARAKEAAELEALERESRNQAPPGKRKDPLWAHRKLWRGK